MNSDAGEKSASTRSQILEEEKIKKTLFNNAMKGNWDEVIKIYQHHGAATHTAKMTRTADTAVHIAISDGQVSAVVELVSAAANTPRALEIKNELGNTPLHLAASHGNVIVCDRIAGLEPKLAGIRNADNETPFFLAVHHGQKDAFLCLHHHCRENGYTYARRNDGETILHSAISGEYFDLSFQIIHLYPKLVNSVNEQGFSPLHLLASKPSAFRSGSHIRGFEKLIYHCIFVDELVKKSSYNTRSRQLEPGTNKKYPGNYQTCVDFLIWIKNLILVLLGFDEKLDNEQLDSKHRKSDHKQVGSSKHLDIENVDTEEQQLDPNIEYDEWSVEFSAAAGSSKHSDIEKVDSKGQQPDVNKQEQGSSISQAQGRHQFFPDNYLTCFHGLKLLSKSMLVILGLGSMRIVKLREKKQKHIWSLQIMETLLTHASMYEYEDNGRGPNLLPTQNGETTPYALIDGGGVDFSKYNLMEPLVHDDHSAPITAPPPSSNDPGSVPASTDGNIKLEYELEMEKKETPLLIAAKNGVTEMVERIVLQFPVAVHDMNNEKKNAVLLAVENRQPHVYNFLLEHKMMKEIIFRKRDNEGNSALHLAARLGEHRPWLIPGAALQMQWEIKWFEFVKDSMPHHFFARFNRKGQTPRNIFTATHRNLVKEGGQWLTNTSESCSVVAALIATVAFATASTVPGGIKSESGIPTLADQPAFCIFAVASLVALCFSVTAVIMFLAILTSRYQQKDFGTNLPRKLLVGLTSLFVSIASMLVSFSAGHYFVLKDKLQYAAFPVYAVTCLPVTFFAIAQFPLYFDLAWATFKKVPQRSYK